MSVRAEAVTSQISCDNEVVSVPERGRIDVVTRPLIVKVGTFKNKMMKAEHFYQLPKWKLCNSHYFFPSQAEGTEMTKTYNWLLCPKGQYDLHQAWPIKHVKSQIDCMLKHVMEVFTTCR